MLLKFLIGLSSLFLSISSFFSLSYTSAHININVKNLISFQDNRNCHYDTCKTANISEAVSFCIWPVDSVIASTSQLLPHALIPVSSKFTIIIHNLISLLNLLTLSLMTALEGIGLIIPWTFQFGFSFGFWPNNGELTTFTFSL
jgi:hypothetical protein